MYVTQSYHKKSCFYSTFYRNITKFTLVHPFSQFFTREISSLSYGTGMKPLPLRTTREFEIENTFARARNIKIIRRCTSNRKVTSQAQFEHSYSSQKWVFTRKCPGPQRRRTSTVHLGRWCLPFSLDSEYRPIAVYAYTD